jgi:DNA-binding NtrC family response regulator
MHIAGESVDIAYKFEGYRVLLVHNEEPIWDAIHSRIMETDCDLFAVNSAKDAWTLMQLMAFDIIISAYDRNQTNGRELFQNVSGPNRNAIKILQKKRRDSGMKWRLLLSGVNGLNRNSLELESMLAVISNRFDGNGGFGQHDAGIDHDTCCSGAFDRVEIDRVDVICEVHDQN